MVLLPLHKSVLENIVEDGFVTQIFKNWPSKNAPFNVSLDSGVPLSKWKNDGSRGGAVGSSLGS